MTDRDRLNACPVTAPDLPEEADHFYRCPGCGEPVDARRLGDVLHHEGNCLTDRDEAR